MSLVDKLNSIEQDFLRRSTRSTALSALEDVASRDPNNAIGDEQPPSIPDAGIYTWPHFKKNRAIIAGICTVVSTSAALCACVFVVWYLLGTWGCLYLWLLFEWLFMLIQRGIYRRLNGLKVEIPPDYDGSTSFKRFLAIASAQHPDGSAVFNLESYVSEWVMPSITHCRVDAFSVHGSQDRRRQKRKPAGATDIRFLLSNAVDNIQLLCYCCVSRKEMVEAGYDGIPEWILHTFEKLLGRTFVDGYNPQLKYMAHTREPLRCSFRPIVFYAFAEFAGILSSTILVALGFRKTTRGVTYATYTFGHFDHSSPKPIVFLHGVGFGILPYVDFIASLVCTGHPVVIIEYRHVSMRLTTEIPSCAEVAAVVIAELDRLSIPDACFVAHSYGTFVLTRLVKIYPQRIHACCFIDPVCLGMFLPQLLSQFVYLSGNNSGILQKLREIVRTMVSREMTVAATMSRRLTWSDVNLWTEDLIPHRSLIVFAGKDVLVPSKEMMPIFKASAAKTKGLKTLIHANLAHGEFLMFPRWKLEIVNEICALAATVKGDDGKRDKVARRRSLMMSLEAMDDVRSPLLRGVDHRLWNSIRRTLSLPWMGERRSFASLNRLSSVE